MNINFFKNDNYIDSIFFTIDEFGEDILFSSDHIDLCFIYNKIFNKSYCSTRPYRYVYSYQYHIDCLNNNNSCVELVVEFHDNHLSSKICVMSSQDEIIDEIILDEEQSNELVNKLIEYYIKNIFLNYKGE